MHKFPFRIEFCPNPDVIVIHTRSRFPKSDTMDSLDIRYCNKNRQERGVKRHPLYLALSKVHGVVSASTSGNGGDYGLHVCKANNLFTWDEILPKVLAAIQTTVAGKRKMIETNGPSR